MKFKNKNKNNADVKTLLRLLVGLFTLLIIVSCPINQMEPDTTAPVITVGGYTNGQSVDRIINDGFSIPAAMANDDVDGSVAVSINEGGYDNAVAGTYSVVYSASDMASNTSTFTLTINVIGVDTMAPVITVVGGYTNNQLVLVEQGSGFVIPEATANDNVDGSVAVSTNEGGYDNTVAGTYTVVYSASDMAGNTSMFTLILNVADRTSPVITVSSYTNGQSIDRITNDGFMIPEAIANDNIDGSVAVSTNEGGYDNVVAGTYTVIYSASDMAGNTNTFTLSINVIDVDTMAPVITVVGGYTNNQLVLVEQGSGFVIPEATANDNVDGSVAVSTNEGGYDNTVAGTYTVVYSASDMAGNTSMFTLILNVADRTSPVITVSGYTNGQSIDRINNDGFMIPEAIANDNIDGSVVVSTNEGGYDNVVAGTYTVIYSASDMAGNTSTFTLTINVIDVDTMAPVITVVGGYTNNQLVLVEQGSGFVIPEATANDNVDGSVAVSTNEGGYDNTVAGTYTVVYSASDMAGNTSMFTLILNVADRTSPVITVSGYTNGQSIDRINNDGFMIPEAIANDNIDGSVVVSTNEGGYDNVVAGTYTVIYSASDMAGNTSTFTLTINVIDVDTEAPVITVSGYTNGQSIQRGINDGFTIPDAMANDNIDGVVTVRTDTNGYDNAVAGTYSISYEAEDAASNTAQFQLTIIINPTLSLRELFNLSSATNDWDYYDEDHTDGVQSGSFTVSNGLAEVVSGPNANDLVGIERGGFDFVGSAILSNGFRLRVTVDSVSATSSSDNPHFIGIRRVSSADKNNKIEGDLGVSIYEENGVMMLELVVGFNNFYATSIPNFTIEDYKDGFELLINYYDQDAPSDVSFHALRVEIDGAHVYGLSRHISLDSGGTSTADILIKPNFDSDSYVKLNHGGGGVSVKYDIIDLRISDRIGQ